MSDLFKKIYIYLSSADAYAPFIRKLLPLLNEHLNYPYNCS